MVENPNAPPIAQLSDDGPIPVEVLFSSRGRIKIIRLLAECGELNISEIARRTQLNHSTTRRHLQLLERAKLVQEKTFGRIRIYRYKIENLRALALRRFIELWEKSE
ncbi:MAG: winged helix-turn-helix domain-containing protein [Candidatus Hermodarchaeia archaeon]|jgi:DNA-binding transcriptional ArsR family regulator